MNIPSGNSPQTLGSQLSVSHTVRKDAGRPASNREIFAGMVGKQRDALNTKGADRAREVAQQYVAGALVLPLLKQAREARDSAPPFGMTDAEKKLGSLMDNRIANDMVRRGNWALVDRITQQLQSAGKPQAAATDTPAAGPASSSIAPVAGVNP